MSKRARSNRLPHATALFKITSSCMLSVLCLLPITPSHAQEKNEQQASPIMLEEVIVTAQKRSQNLQDVPVAVSVMSGDKLQEAGIQDLQELGPYVPNFFQTATPTSNLIFIRGIGSGDNPSFEQSVGVFHDGIYWGRGRQTLSPLYDLDRIEVLKGPQGVLFGKNTVAGAVSSTSARPTDEFSGNIMVASGSLEERKMEAAISGPITSGPITDKILSRLAVHYQESDGWVKNEFSGSTEPIKETSGFRLGTEYDINNALTAYLKLEWNSFDLTGNSYEIVGITRKPLQIPAIGADTEVPPHLDGLEDRFDGRANWGNTNMPGSEGSLISNDFANHMLQFDWDVDGYTLTSVTGFSSYNFSGSVDVDFSPVDFIGLENTEIFDQYSQEIRIQSPGDSPFSYIAGIYFQHSKLDWDLGAHAKITSVLDGVLSPLSISGVPGIIPGIRESEGVSNIDYELTTNSASIFFQGTYDLSDRLRLTLGARYTSETKEVEKDVSVTTFDGVTISANDAQAFAANPANTVYENTALTPAFLSVVLDQVWLANLEAFPYQLSDRRSENSLTPQLILQWDANEETMVYASATTGFKAGGFDTNHANGSTPESLARVEYEDGKVLAFEIGAKATLMDNRINLNAAIYRTAYEDLQVSIFNGTSAFYVNNAGDATSQGLEMEARFMATASLELSASIAWTHFEYDTYKGGQCTIEDQAEELLRLGIENPDRGDYSNCRRDLTGVDAPFSPDRIASISFTHFMSVTDKLQLVSTLDANYSDEYFLSADLDPMTLQDDYTKVNLRLSLMEDSGWALSFMVKNLTEEDTSSSAEDIPFGNGNAYASKICADPLSSGAVCNDARNQLADSEGSFYRVTDSPRRYIVEARYRF